MSVNREYVPSWRNFRIAPSNDYDNGMDALYRQYFIRKINAGGAEPCVVAYSHGATCLANAYRGAVMNLDGDIFLMPYGQTTAAIWHKIIAQNGDDRVLGYTHGCNPGTFKNPPNSYYEGFLHYYPTYKDRIYLIPTRQGSVSNPALEKFHYINTSNNTVVAYSMEVGGYELDIVDYACVGFWRTKPGPGGQLYTYLVPYKQGTVDYFGATNLIFSKLGEFNNVPFYKYKLTTNAYKFAATTTEDKVYLIPENQSVITTWHYVNTTTGVPSAYSHGGSISVDAYYDGVYSQQTNRVYLTPQARSTSSIWHYIDCLTDTVVAYTHTATCVANAYRGGVLSPDGRIYLIPYGQATATVWHYIDPSLNDVVSYTHGMSCVASAYIGGCIDKYGRIWLSPYGQSTAVLWHYIDTNTTELFNTTTLISPYIAH